MTLHKALLQRDDTDSLYVSRKGEKVLASIKDCVKASEQRCLKFNEKKQEWLITASNKNHGNMWKKKKKKTSE